MNNSYEIMNYCVNKINASAVSVERASISSNFIARTGVYAKVPGNHNKIFVGGYSCKPCKEDASAVAKFEVTERLLATYYFSDPRLRDSTYPAYNYLTDNYIHNVSADEVLIGPTAKNTKANIDAVGLSYHTHRKSAVSHAVYELLERHILAKIWYDNLRLFKIDETYLNDCTLSFYTIQAESCIPFIMAVITDRVNSFLCVGASFAESMHRAHDKAKSEAIMLASDLFDKKELKHLENSKSINRMQSQSCSKMSKKRQLFLESITTCKTSYPHYSDKEKLASSLSVIGIDIGKFSYCILHESSKGFIIRAINGELRSLRDYRADYIGTEKGQLDPVC